MDPLHPTGGRMSRRATLLSFVTLLGAALPALAPPLDASAPLETAAWHASAQQERPCPALGGCRPPVARVYREDLTE